MFLRALRKINLSPSKIREGFPLFSFFVLIVALKIYYFNYFYVPESDFFDLWDKARSLINLEWPSSYQRPPFYPFMMGIVSLLLPTTEEPILIAAELINLVAFISSCILLYLISRRFLGNAAFVVLCLFALNPLSVLETAQPRMDMLAIMLVLLSIFLSSRSVPASYFSAFCASLTRYEGAFIIPALVLKDLLFSRSKAYCLGLGIVSSSGLVSWVILNYLATGHINPYYVYVGGELKPAGLEFVRVLMITLLNIAGPEFVYLVPLKVTTSLVAIFMCLGFYHFFKTDRRVALLILIFFLQGLIVNLIFFAPAVQHTYVILWVCYMAGVGGIYFLVYNLTAKMKTFIDGKNAWLLPVSSRILYALFVGLGICVVVLLVDGNSGHENPLLWFSLACFLVLVWNLYNYISITTLGNALMIGVMVVLIAGVSAKNAMTTAHWMNGAKYWKAEMKLIGEWYSHHANDSGRMVVTEPWVVKYYTAKEYQDKLVYLGDFDVSSTREFTEEAIRRNITFVAWDMTLGLSSKESYYYKKYRVDLIDPLREGKDIPGFKLIKVLREGPAFAYIYEIEKLDNAKRGQEPYFQEGMGQ